MTPGAGVGGRGAGLPARGRDLLFHVSLLVVLVGFAIGSLWGYKGGVIVVNGQGFSNSLSQYDDFAPGALFGPDLSPFEFTVDDFRVKFLESGEQAGMPTEFSADLTYTERPGAPKKYDLAVNHPLSLDGGPSSWSSTLRPA